MADIDNLLQGVQIEAINRESKQVLLADGTVHNMTAFHTVDGDETDDIDEAAFATVELANGKWFPVILSQFGEPTKVH